MIDPVSQRKRQHQHFERGADLHAIGGDEVGRQPAEIAYRQHGDADQQERPGDEEPARSPIAMPQAADCSDHGHDREHRTGERHHDRADAIVDQYDGGDAQCKDADERLDPAVESWRIFPGGEKTAGEQRAEKSRQPESGREGEMPPDRPVGPEEFVTEAVCRELAGRHAESEQHVEQETLVAHGQEEQEVVAHQGEHHSEVKRQCDVSAAGFDGEMLGFPYSDRHRHAALRAYADI